ncbi:MAG: vWA domain-containing protein [Planctomycetales bacterium]
MLIQRKTLRSVPRHGQHNRRGIVLVLFAVLLTAIMAGIAFSIDVAYMQLTRTEMQAASDAAAKAASVSLAKGQGSTAAKNAAVTAAAANKVGGKGFTITTNNVTLGGLKYGSNGAWDFVAGQTPLMAAKIDVAMGSSSPSGQVNLFFAPLLGSKTFAPKISSTAGFVQNAICLCLDRSGSMCFDMTGVDYSYPAGIPAYPTGYTTPPSATGSRWAYLTSSVKQFLTILDASNNQPPVALVTWASQTSAGSLNGVSYPAFNASDINVTIGTNQSSKINSAISTLGSKKMIGGTNMTAGLTAANGVLMAYTPTLPVNRVIVLFTDGQWNTGSNPVTYANTLKANNIKCHTIGLLTTGSAVTDLQSIATTTGGKSFIVTDSAALTAAFTEIAADLRIVLTQ